MLNLDHYVISPQSANQALVCYLLVDNIVFCRGSKDELYYVYDVMLGTLRRQQRTLHYDKCSTIANFRKAWHWVPPEIWEPVRDFVVARLYDKSGHELTHLSDRARVIEDGYEKITKMLLNNTAPKIGGNIARIFNCFANRRVSGDELTKGLKALGVQVEMKIQASYLGGWNIEGCTIESFLKQCAGQPDE